MAERKSNGCAVAAGVVGVVAILVLISLGLGIRGCFSMVRSKHREAMHAQEEAREFARQVGDVPANHELVFSDKNLPLPQPHRKGQALTRENWLAWELDDQATQFARQAFQEAADGSPVDWMLRTEEVFEARDGAPQGRFGLPVRVERRSGSSRTIQSMIITVDADLGAVSPEQLMGVRRGDWVRVAGQLSLKGDSLRIIDARIVDGDADPPLER